jgi:prepilin-type N-terminal cleavage/methylation domain-containing protein
MNIAEKLSRGSRGFTLIEMMMVVIIILIMSSFVAANFRSGQSEFALLRANQQLISDIRKKNLICH